MECKSDSQHAVELVFSDPPCRHVYASLIWDIKDLLQRAWKVELVHTLREGNAYTDFLVKYGANQDENLVLLESPGRVG